MGLPTQDNRLGRGGCSRFRAHPPKGSLDHEDQDDDKRDKDRGCEKQLSELHQRNPSFLPARLGGHRPLDNVSIPVLRTCVLCSLSASGLDSTSCSTAWTCIPHHNYQWVCWPFCIMHPGHSGFCTPAIRCFTPFSSKPMHHASLTAALCKNSAVWIVFLARVYISNL